MVVEVLTSFASSPHTLYDIAAENDFQKIFFSKIIGIKEIINLSETAKFIKTLFKRNEFSFNLCCWLQITAGYLYSFFSNSTFDSLDFSSCGINVQCFN